MLFSSLILMLVSNAVTVWRDKSILFSRVALLFLIFSSVKGYFHINPFIAISFAITIFSFVGIPPVIGFFAKQMILSAALDNGYIFMALVAIITSVIGAGYYLNLIKQIFFFKSDYQKNSSTNNITLLGHILPDNFENLNSKLYQNSVKLRLENIKLNGAISRVIFIITLLFILFIFMSEEWFNIVSINTYLEFS